MRLAAGRAPRALEPARFAIERHGPLHSVFEADLRVPSELAPGAGAVANPLLEELVQLVAGEHHGTARGTTVELGAERRRLDQAAWQVEAELGFLAHGGFGEHDELFERV